tara:strand:- start:177 stop:1475 length:1299 start_codon:yes stop_codon:yes gene_type:complete
MNRLLLVAACLLYGLSLSWSYVNVEGLMGFQATYIRPFSAVYEVAGFVLIAGLASFVMPLRISKPSDVALWMLFLLWLVPSLLLTYHVGTRPAQEIFQFLVAVSASFVLLVLLCRGPLLKVPRLSIPSVVYKAALVIPTIALSGVVVELATRTNINSTVNLFDLSEVYVRRLEAQQVMESGSFPMFGYALALLGSSLAPICFIYGLIRRRALFVALGLTGLLSMFFLDGTKSNLFLPVLFAGMLALGINKGSQFGTKLAFSLTGLVAVGGYLWIEHQFIWISSLFTRRMIMAKATTLGAYYETFRGAPVLMQDFGPMRLIGVTPSTSKANLVGQSFGAGLSEGWNGNGWSSMYADFGIGGLVIASALAAILLRLFDGTSRYAPFQLVAAMCGYVAFVWGETALTTSILTYGVLVSLLLLLQYRMGPEERRVY